ncbi:CPBP family intramembrane glutamic endopeptidase [Papillibacter cinnamivorans]|uniref:CAAX prenyl protease 2/Lysostaphin resistance protein A-like domain-containing protein n=1 Tax=Papillibacter cinnamivorans DSM 12816 TaxID=1122930 RepID=A0A1W1ZIM7_9FIRM|nr:CPBP family intramembrane glutamic endopeptidase [Papillibacter cinnamivorans]SMC48380.1 hypothetical protein SAMN02745168_1154 [Papillibacter cinnamivorans DSM 12816]
MKGKVLVQSKKRDSVFLLLLLGLFILRFPFLISVSYGVIPIPKDMGNIIFGNVTYLITAVLILIMRDSLSKYNIGFYSLAVFLAAPFFKLLSIRYTAMFSLLPYPWFQIAVSICLFILLLIFHPKLRKRSSKEILFWLLIAVAAGICGGVIMGNIASLQGSGRLAYRPSFCYVIYAFFVQLSNAAVMEEPLFRGFLWGYLKNAHCKETWIWAFQAALFMIGHVYYLGVYNYSFWIIVPVSALILGLLAWRSRSIGTSMIAHGLINSIADAVAHFTW